MATVSQWVFKDILPRSFVAQLAPQVDRLFIAVHRAAGPAGRVILDELGLQNFGVLVDLRKLMLSPSGMLPGQAEALERYRDPREIDADLDAHVRQGLLQRQGERIFPTEEGREILLRLTRNLARSAETLWPDEETTSRSAGVAMEAIDRAASIVSAESYPAFTAEAAGYMPADGSSSMRLWSGLSSLRYLRADSHTLAWREAGLTLWEISILTSLCNNQSPNRVKEVRPGEHVDESRPRAALGSLRKRHWVTRTGGTWVVTPEGREARQLIEVRTNEYNLPAYTALSAERRVAFLADLRHLPDEVP
jgi:DNA-binding MarR family transcriptional regulator